jgi:hypothetical protein
VSDGKLDVGLTSHAVRTAHIREGIEPALEAECMSIMIALGDASWESQRISDAGDAHSGVARGVYRG